ncbi:multidrug efflux system outer membrane protein [Paraburkholderia sp. GAS333]|uniref:efflux transporter outer membrane subunit n=1 Tax=Paraburkholderia sp. GAS333 TaxID=3156279 RepID=UPI003D225BD1
MNTRCKCIFAAAVSLFMVTGCTLMPDYRRPDAAVAQQFPDAQAHRDNAVLKSVGDLRWRDFYQDPELDGLIQMALANNQDLRVSVLNIEKAQAEYRIRRADLLPTLSASASDAVERYPQDVSPTGYAETAHDYSVQGAVASYELDIFGRVRSLSQEALQNYFSLEATRKAFQITLISEVAQGWLTYQADANLMKLSADTLKSQNDAYRITSAKYKYGTSSLLDVTQAETSVRTAESNLAEYQRQMKQDVNALTLLVGKAVPTNLLDVREMDALKLNDALSPGVPSDLLTRRPDIVAAEDSLKAANADIGAARAAFFPRIELTASGGTASARLGGLFEPGSGAWSFGPNISIPIFDYGRNAANLKVSKVQRDIAVATYQKTIQTAFREVSDALAGLDTYRSQETAGRQLVDASAKAYKLSSDQYADGVTDYLDVLVNQRSLYSAQQNLIKLRLAHAGNTLSLYTALGGGWNQADSPDTPNAPATQTVSAR